MWRKLRPSSRPRVTLRGNSYHKEQLVRGQLWLTFRKNHKQWHRSKIRRVSPFSCFRGQFESVNNTVTLPYTQPQQIGLSAENWTQLHVSAGCPGRRGLQWSSHWGPAWSLAGLINPSLLRAGLTQLVLACEQKEQGRRTGLCAQPFYHSMRGSPTPAQLHTGSQIKFTRCCPAPAHFPAHALSAISHCLNFTSVPLNWIMDHWLQTEKCQPNIIFSFLHGKGNLWNSCVESASTQVTHILRSLLFRKLNSLDYFWLERLQQ